MSKPRINAAVTAFEVVLIGPDGDKLGTVPTSNALSIARQLQLDLVEINPISSPPVCKILDFERYTAKGAMIRGRQAERWRLALDVIAAARCECYPDPMLVEALAAWDGFVEPTPPKRAQ
jgi:hypothetical protein